MDVLWSRYAWPEKLHPNHQSNELVYLLCCHRGISPPGYATNLGKEGTGQSTNTIAISNNFTVQQMITTIGVVLVDFFVVRRRTATSNHGTNCSVGKTKEKLLSPRRVMYSSCWKYLNAIRVPADRWKQGAWI